MNSIMDTSFDAPVPLMDTCDYVESKAAVVTSSRTSNSTYPHHQQDHLPSSLRTTTLPTTTNHGNNENGDDNANANNTQPYLYSSFSVREMPPNMVSPFYPRGASHHQQYNNDEENNNEDDNDENSIATPIPLPPATPKRCRSDSPTGTMDVRFFRDDYFDDSFELFPFSVPDIGGIGINNVNTDINTNIETDDDDINDCCLEHSNNSNIDISRNISIGTIGTLEPLPLLSSVSSDLSDLLHHYLPKTKLEFYNGPCEDENEHEDAFTMNMKATSTMEEATAAAAAPTTTEATNTLTNTKINAMTVETVKMAMMRLQLQLQNTNTVTKRNLLPDFQLCQTTDSQNDAMLIENSNPFSFVLKNKFSIKQSESASSNASSNANSNAKPSIKSKSNAKASAKKKVQSPKKKGKNPSTTETKKKTPLVPISISITLPTKNTTLLHQQQNQQHQQQQQQQNQHKFQAIKNQIKKDVQELTVKTVVDENTRIVEKTWEQNYLRLANFYKKHGHSNVLRSDSDKQLSGWVKRQRNNLKDNKLTDSQINRLKDLDFVWNRLENAWDYKYKLLLQYVQKHDTCEVPTKYNRSLAEWTQRQRRERRNKTPTMTAQRVAKLNEIPHWSWSSKAWSSRKQSKCATSARVERCAREVAAAAATFAAGANTSSSASASTSASTTREPNLVAGAAASLRALQARAAEEWVFSFHQQRFQQQHQHHQVNGCAGTNTSSFNYDCN